MIAEITLALTALLLYRKIKLRSLLLVAVSVLLGMLTKFAVIFLAGSLAYLCYEVILASAYKPLNKSEE